MVERHSIVLEFTGRLSNPRGIFSDRTPQQFKLQEKYYYANKFIIDLLNTNSNVSAEVCEKIE
ncbi:NACHT C-terminal helical domain 2-containing protein [Dapis sp. BLCC M229]|uniref:NACHT C-terminal helical domain 2-containing protein n=1 Tax=Dapis sp. BLCC M229 TaxID=3400188 RepID=UPI003CEC269C